MGPAPLRPAVLLGVLVVLVFAGTLGNGFVYDDHFLIEENPKIQSFAYLGQALTSDAYLFYSNQANASSYYRPILYITYMADSALWGLRPLGFHATNIAFHLAAVFLAYLVLFRIYRRVEVAFWAAALWALHPVTSESVAWVTGRTDVMAAGFLLAALYLFIRHRETRRPGFLIGAMAATYLACLSKETAAVIPALAVVVDLSRGENRPRGPRLKAPLLLAGAVGVFLVQRSLILETFTTARFPGDSRFEALRTFLNAVVYYTRSLFWPVDLVGDIHVQPPPAGSLAVGVGGVIALSLLGLGLFLLWRRPRSALPVAWILGLMVPAAGILVPIPYPVATRYLYLPSLGLLLGLVLLLEGRGSVRLRRGLLGVLVLALGGLTVLRNAEYRDDRTLYAAVIDHSTDVGLGINPGYNALINYSAILGEDGNLTRSEALLRQAIAQEPARATAWNNLGIVMGMTNRVPEAMEVWTRATELDPTDPDPLLNLARTYERNGRIDAALAAYRRVLAVAVRPVPEVQQRIDALQGRGEP